MGKPAHGNEVRMSWPGESQAAYVFQADTAADLGFALGPRLNAVGRLDDMSLGVACLLCDDLNLARQLAAEMDSLNQERKEIEQGMQQEALATLEPIRFRDGEVPSGIVLHRDEWHQGGGGLVAGHRAAEYLDKTAK